MPPTTQEPSSRRIWVVRAAIAVAIALAVPVAVGLFVPGVSVRSLVGAQPLPTSCAQRAARIQLPLHGRADAQWRPGPALPKARDEVRAVGVGDRIYVGTGLEPRRGPALGFGSLAEMHVFDPTHGTYARVPSLPLRIDHAALAGTDTGLYVFGGWSDEIPTGRAFELVDGTWKELRPMPTPRAGAAAVVVGNDVYVIGGSTSPHDSGSLPGSGVVEIFDTRTKTWSEGPELPTPRHHHAAAAVDGVVTVVGGRDGPSFSMAAVEHLDTRTGRWRTGRPLPLASGALTAATSGGRLIVTGGGDDADGWVTPATWELISDGSWTRLPDLAVARHGHGMAALGDTVYVFGGSPCAGYGTTETVEVLDLR